MSNCPLSGKNCIKYKCYQITDLKKDNISNFNVCEDCLCDIDKKIDLDQKIILNSCDFCGLTLEEFVKKGRLGCSQCYIKFDKPLIIALEKIHFEPSRKNNKEIKHTGSVPYSWKMNQIKQKNPEDYVIELEKKLKICISEEDYKKADILNKQINSIKLLIDKFNKHKNEYIKDQIYELIFSFEKLEEDLKNP